MINDDQAKLILMSEFIEQKVRKEKELEFYQEELQKLTSKIQYLTREVDLTSTIIELIKTDNVYDFKEKWVEQEEKKNLLSNKSDGGRT